jgi:hypothetical protein
MSTNIKLKRSSVAGNVPTTSQLSLGELAINTADGKIYLKKDDGTESIVEVNEHDKYLKAQRVGWMPGGPSGGNGISTENVYYSSEENAVIFEHTNSTNGTQGIVFKMIHATIGQKMVGTFSFKANQTISNIYNLVMYQHTGDVGSGDTHICGHNTIDGLATATTSTNLASAQSTSTSYNNIEFEHIAPATGYYSFGLEFFGGFYQRTAFFRGMPEFKTVGVSLNEVIAMQYLLG